MHHVLPRYLIHSLVIAGLVLVACVDYLTGVEIRIFPLYFLPLMLAAWQLNVAASTFYALVSSIIWALIMYFSGREYSAVYVLAINFITQSIAFLLVSLLVNKLRRVLEQERRLSRTDVLTGLPNRRQFFERSNPLVQLCRRHDRPVTLSYLDLDNFKHANDELGHEFGDKLLKAVALIFRKHLRTTDVYARIGGDEFVMLLPETDADHAQLILERVRNALARNVGFIQSGVTASIGAVTYNKALENVDDMIAEADKLMYHVKRGSKNRVRIETARLRAGSM